MASKSGDHLERIRSEKERWIKQFKVDQSPQVMGDLGMTIDAVYTPADIQDTDYLRDIGFPGEYPFTRGPYPEMSRHRRLLR